MDRRRPTRSRPRRVIAAIRLLWGVLLALVLVGQSTVAWAFPCSVGADECSEADEPGRGDEDAPGDRGCSCPIDCSPCCAGQAKSATPPEPPSFEPSGAAWTEIEEPRRDEAPPSADPGDILHVPKRARA